MNVHWYRNIPHDTVEVFVEVAHGRYLTLSSAQSPDSTTVREVQVEQGGRAPAFLILQPSFAEELARGMGSLPVPTDATISHLSDAVGVRDRLLALVEYTIKEPR